MLPEQRPPLTLGHAAPHTELHPVVESVRAALELNRAMPADRGGLTLGRAADEQVIGVPSPASRL